VTLKKGFCDAPFASTDFGAAVIALTLAAQTTLAKRTMMLFLRARLSSRQQTAHHEPITQAAILSGPGECKQQNNLLPKDDVITLRRF
jgi:hypothetical protein